MKIKKLTSIFLSICLSLTIGIQVKAVDTNPPKIKPQDEFNANIEKYLDYARERGFAKYLNIDALVADFTRDNPPPKPRTIKTFKKYTEGIDVEKTKSTIKNDEDLKKLLDTTFGSLITPVGEWNFSFKVFQNDCTKEYLYMSVTPYDYRVEINWTNGINPYDLLETSKKYTEKQRNETIELLKNYGKQVADFLIELNPDKKISGSFYANNLDKKDLYSVTYARFLTWVNYDNSYMDAYLATKRTNFYWDVQRDSCIFSK